MKSKLFVLICAALALYFVLRSPQNRSSIERPLPPTVPVKPAQNIAALAATDLREWIAAERRGEKVDLQAGLKLAEERRESMRAMMKENPARALRQSLSWAEWKALPPELQAVVERPFSSRVDLQVIPNCPPGDPTRPTHRVMFEGAWRETFVFGNKVQITSKEQLPARGIFLNGQVVLAEGAVERISAGDLEAVQEMFPAGGATNLSSVSGEALGGEARTVLIGGIRYAVASDDEEADMQRTLSAAEKSFHPKSVAMALAAAGAGAGTIAFDVTSAKKTAAIASSSWTETAKTQLAVRISYSDSPTSYSFSPADATNLVIGISNNVKVMSYGKTWVVPTVVTVTLANNQAFYQSGGPDSIVAGTRDALAAIGVNPDAYDFVTHLHPQMNFAYAGLGYIGGGIAWLNGAVNVDVATHEIGHNYGLGHAHYWASFTGMGSLGHTQPGDGSLMEKEEYGDPYDIMGGSTLPQGQYTAHGKAALNWIEPTEVINVVTNGIYRVFRYDHKDARTNAGTKLAIKVSCPSGEEYWISHRRLWSANANTLRAAFIHRADGTGDQSLIDTTPLSKPLQTFGTDRDDAPLAIGKSFYDSLGTTRITTIASGGTFPQEYLDVQVTFLDNGAFSFYTATDLKTNGLVGSYVNVNLESRAQQDDWRTAVAIAGKRVDRTLSFTSDSWGLRAPLHLTGGTDANWDQFSVQWDGVIVVRRPIRLATTSDDSSRFWIDLNKDGIFAPSGAEFVNNHWGTPQGPTRGDLSGVIPPGTYPIRIQYEEGGGGNYFVITGAETPFELFTSAAATTRGLVGRYVAQDLRTLFDNDWSVSQTIAGTRVDPYPGFTINGWGTLASVGLTTTANGADADWNNFSVQWDGYLSNSVAIKMATISDDQSRMWIDINKDGNFGTASPELINNNWGGGGQGATMGSLSQSIPPGLYRIRIQYEEGGGDNRFLLGGVAQLPTDPIVLFSGLTFNGTDNRTSLRTVAGDFTIEFWFHSAQIAGGENDWREGMGLIDASAASAPGFGVSFGNGKVLFGVSGAVTQTIRSGFLADDLWHHVAARRSIATGEIRLFIDGNEVARAPGGTDLLNGAQNVTAGSLSDGSNHYIGQLDQVRIWDTARDNSQILADYQLNRSGRGAIDPPAVRIAQLQPNSYQIFWDALSSYRVLEAAANVTGPWVTLPTDQNSTNVPTTGIPIRYFRVKKP